jgi:hypothetical protein
MTMFRRSSTRRTTCPAYGGVPDGPVAAGEGPVAAGSVTTRTVEERSWPGCSTRRGMEKNLIRLTEVRRSRTSGVLGPGHAVIPGDVGVADDLGVMLAEPVPEPADGQLQLRLRLRRRAHRASGSPRCRGSGPVRTASLHR